MVQSWAANRRRYREETWSPPRVAEWTLNNWQWSLTPARWLCSPWPPSLIKTTLFLIPEKTQCNSFNSVQVRLLQEKRNGFDLCERFFFSFIKGMEQNQTIKEKLHICRRSEGWFRWLRDDCQQRDMDCADTYRCSFMQRWDFCVYGVSAPGGNKILGGWSLQCAVSGMIYPSGDNCFLLPLDCFIPLLSSCYLPSCSGFYQPS